MNCSCFVLVLFLFSFLPSLLGKDTEPHGSGVFPQDTVVAVGSDVTICCVHEEGQQIKRMTYGPEAYPLIRLSSRSSAIRVLNASASDTSGTNVVCSLSEDGMDGTVLFVGCMYNYVY